LQTLQALTIKHLAARVTAAMARTQPATVWRARGHRRRARARRPPCRTGTRACARFA
jgi:hypothetical protein